MSRLVTTRTTNRGRGRNVAATHKNVRLRAKPASEKDYMKAFGRWERGENISVLAAELRVRRGTIRHHFTRIAGGHDEFKALRAAGAGNLRPSLGERPLRASYDKGARVIPVGARRNWRYRTLVIGKETVPAFVAPGRGKSSTTYIPAGARQKSDVIAEMGNGLPPARLVKYIRPMKGAAQ